MVNNTDPASAVEVKTAVSYMKSGKAPGTDGVSVDMVKGGGDIVVRTLTEIFEGIWEAEEIPGDLKIGLIVILQKGDHSLCNNWTFLSVTCNVFCRVSLVISHGRTDAQRTGSLSERNIL